VFQKNLRRLANLDNLPDPETLAEELIENLESALDGLRLALEKLKKWDKNSDSFDNRSRQKKLTNITKSFRIYTNTIYF
jgi:hypothetical protein